MTQIYSILNTGAKIPLLGLGTWQSKPNEAYEAVKLALEIGYRHIDCAFIYRNEEEVGKALKDFLGQPGAPKREELFITTKLWNTFHRPAAVKPAFEKSLANLGLDYIDLFLIHWPFAFIPGGDLFPKDAQGNIQEDQVSFEETWKAVEDLLSTGQVKAIGVSNFNVAQLTRLLASAKVVPAVNQVELHPYLQQKELLEFCKSKGIMVTAYSPLGSPGRPSRSDDQPVLLEDLKVQELAKKYNKTVSQILLRFHIENGVAAIPKSITPDRIKENFQVFDFKFTNEDRATLASLDKKFRFITFADAKQLKEYPFEL